MQQYRLLEKGEIIQKGDQCDRCVNPWRDKPKWEDVVGNIGEPAPDPALPSHRKYRRPVCPEPGMHEAIQLAIVCLAGGFQVETADELAEKHPAAAGALRVLLPFAEAKTMTAIKKGK